MFLSDLIQVHQSFNWHLPVPNRDIATGLYKVPPKTMWWKFYGYFQHNMFAWHDTTKKKSVYYHRWNDMKKKKHFKSHWIWQTNNHLLSYIDTTGRHNKRLASITNLIVWKVVSEYTWDYSLLYSRLFILFLFLYICQLHMFFSSRSIKDITCCFLLVYPLVGHLQP